MSGNLKSLVSGVLIGAGLTIVGINTCPQMRTLVNAVPQAPIQAVVESEPALETQMDNSLFSKLESSVAKSIDFIATPKLSTFEFETRRQASEQCDVITFEHTSKNELTFECFDNSSLRYSFNYDLISSERSYAPGLEMLRSVHSGSASACDTPKEKKAFFLPDEYTLCMAVQVADNDSKDFLSISPNIFVRQMPAVFAEVDRQFEHQAKEEAINPTVKAAQHSSDWQKLKIETE